VPLRLTPDYRLGVAGTSVSVSLCACQRRHRSRRPFGLHLPEKPSSDRVTRTNGFKIRCPAGEWQMAAEALRSIFLCSLTGLVAPPRDIGATPRGTRRYYPAIGGSFEGPRLRGEVLPDGGDWLLTRPDGVLEQDVRITLSRRSRNQTGQFRHACLSTVRAILDDPSIHIRPSLPAHCGCRGKEPYGFSHFGMVIIPPRVFDRQQILLTTRHDSVHKRLRFFADRAAKKWPLRGSLKPGVGCL
jgi:hypothetical protein